MTGRLRTDGILGPPLPGAACTGRAPLHDAVIDGETPERQAARHAQARRVCATCRVRAACAALARTEEVLHPLRGVSGVMAGQLVPEPQYARQVLWQALRTAAG